MRFVDIVGAPMHCTLLRIETNQGITGYGEVRDGSSKVYAQMLKRLLLGENPCNIDKLFRRIKQFGGQSRQAGGVCAVEIALWDIAGKAYGVPIYQMLGGKFRDKIRMYCDTDVSGKDTGLNMGAALKARIEKNGYTFLKMDLGIGTLRDVEGALTAPIGFLAEGRELREKARQARESGDLAAARYWRNRAYDYQNVAHPFTGIHITEKGFDYLENYVAEVRSVIGYDIPLSIDHFGHVGLDDCIKFARRVEKYNLAWLEDLIPWHLTDQYVRLNNSTAATIGTGEDIYLKENFRPLIENGGVGVIHPDLLSSGGILENKKIGDMAQEYGVAMAVHMAETPVACLAAVHSIAATENFLALEFHSNDVPWWSDMVKGDEKPRIIDGFMAVPEKPGLGIDELDDEVLAAHVDPKIPGVWESTDQWNDWDSNDRLWS
ncbi:MAG: mandelate racemase/muconate lactonizing enzyme family protein [Christensenellaceae bacterium]|jgi:L-alanine-DL-glutamate epimerase-like enolase superfamily enzyme|nr:mandelate racemase/muconate lactonizing enzyme family protein [Christensenellaceae bacterium]